MCESRGCTWVSNQPALFASGPPSSQCVGSERSRSSHRRRAVPGLRRDLPNDLGQVHPEPEGPACGLGRPPSALRVPLLVRALPHPLRPAEP